MLFYFFDNFTIFQMFFFFIFSCFSFNYVKETFDSGLFNNWHVPKKLRPTTRLGVWAVSAGDCWGNQQKWLGLTTTKSHRDYIIYTNFTKPMNTITNDLVVQYTVRLNPFVDCAGQFIKLMDSSSDMNAFSQDLPFAIKFGPDICGPSFRRVHVVITYNGTEYETNHPLGFVKDSFTHSYTLIIRRNNTFAVLIDGEIADEATLDERFDYKQTNSFDGLNLMNDPNFEEEMHRQRRIENNENVDPDEFDEEEEEIFLQEMEQDERRSREHFKQKEQEQKTTSEQEKEQEKTTSEQQKEQEKTSSEQQKEQEKTSPEQQKEQKQEKTSPEQQKEKEKEKTNEKTQVKEETKKEDIIPFGHFPSLGYLGIDVHQSCCGSLFDNFLVTDNENEAKKMLYDNFLRYQVEEARSCDKGHGGGGGGDGNEDGNDDTFGNKESRMNALRHKIDFSNFDPL